MNATHLQARLDAVRDLGRLDAEVVERFGRFLETAPDEAVFRTNPIAWGEAHEVDAVQAIDLFLYATHAGVLEMEWGLLCPACAGFIVSADGLRSMGRGGRCQFCEAEVQGILDDNIEVAFTVSPQVRVLRFSDPAQMRPGDAFVTFFSRSVADADMRQELLQKRTLASRVVGAGKSEEFEFELKADGGRTAFMAPVPHAMAYVAADAAAQSHGAQLDLLAGDFLPASVELAPGPAKVRLVNRTKGPVLIHAIDSWLPPPSRRAGFQVPRITLRSYLTGKRLLTSQVFRDLFRADAVPGEGGLALKSLALLFTDLKGSTEMYGRIGDLRAFELVSRHFDLLRDLVRSRGGAVVKTIGDAVMASFAEPAKALDAAAAMNREIGRVGDLELKIGIHAGPCIAVESNEQLDYFGQTVNVAARVQGVAGAGEIVCTDAVVEAPGAAQVIGTAALKSVPDSALLKGVEGAVAIHRMRA